MRITVCADKGTFMTTSLRSVLAAVFVLAAPMAMSADDAATLRVDQGAVMSSEGGEFVTAQTGQVLLEGQRLMVTEGAVATLIYSDDCKVVYDVPGVYVIDEDCEAAMLMADGTGVTVTERTVMTGSTLGTRGSIVPLLIVGGALIAIPLILDDDDDDDDFVAPPVSR